MAVSRPTSLAISSSCSSYYSSWCVFNFFSNTNRLFLFQKIYNLAIPRVVLYRADCTVRCLPGVVVVFAPRLWLDTPMATVLVHRMQM